MTFAIFLLKFCENCCFFKTIFCENFEIAAVQKYANLVELEKYCQKHIFLQKFVLIQPRTSPPKICIILQTIANFPNSSTGPIGLLRGPGLLVLPLPPRRTPGGLRAPGPTAGPGEKAGTRAPVGDTTADRQNSCKMLFVFGCIGTDFCKKTCVLQHFSKSTRLSSFNF